MEANWLFKRVSLAVEEGLRKKKSILVYNANHIWRGKMIYYGADVPASASEMRAGEPLKLESYDFCAVMAARILILKISNTSLYIYQLHR